MAGAEELIVTAESEEEAANWYTSGATPSGVYSGADIKLVVHLPPPDPESQDGELREAQLELARVQGQIESAGSGDETSQLEQRIAEIDSQRDSILDTIGDLEIGSAERESAEDQVEVLNEERLDLQDQLSETGTIDGSVAELRQRETELTAQIEQLQEEGAQPASVTKTLAEITTLSISTHREKYQVRTLGATYPRSICRGPRCLPASEKVLVKDRGYISISEVLPGDYVQSSDATYDKVLGSWAQGMKECHELVLEDGYTLRASYDHPVSTPEGWVNMEDLEKGDSVDVVARTPVSIQDYPISDECLKMIAYLIGDRQVQKYKNTYVVALSIADREMSSVGADIHSCLEKLDIPYRDSRKGEDRCIRRKISVCKTGKGQTDRRLREYNELHYWLLKLGMYGQYSHQKEIPQEFLSGLSKRQVILFLRHLFSTDGDYSVSCDAKRKYVEAKYTSTSEVLVDQIRLLLSKLGILSIKNRNSRLEGQVGGRPDIISRHNAHTLVISSAYNLLRFFRRVGIFGKDDRLKPVIYLLKRRIKDKYLQLSVKDFRLRVRNVLLARETEVRPLCAKYNLYASQRGLTPRRAFKVAEELGDRTLLRFVEEQVENLLDTEEDYVRKKVRRIDPLGKLQVYDLEVENRHAFIASFVRVHNTISGSVVFTTFYEHMFHEFFGASSVRSTGVGDWDRYRWTSYITDQIPPLDISIVFANEFGNFSWMSLLGVEFVNEGMVMSIEDLFIEGTAQYIARDFDPIRNVAGRQLSRNRGVGYSLTGTSLLSQELQLRAGGRRNPFL